MPNRPKYPCQYNGCPALIRSGRYCVDHIPVQKKYNRPADNRPSAYQRGYDNNWWEIRKQILIQQSICIRCGQKKSDTVHHVPAYIRGTDHRQYQLYALCHSCHNAITAQNRRR